MTDEQFAELKKPENFSRAGYALLLAEIDRLRPLAEVGLIVGGQYSSAVEARNMLGNALYPGHNGDAPRGTANTLWAFAHEAARRLSPRPAELSGPPGETTCERCSGRGWFHGDAELEGGMPQECFVCRGTGKASTPGSGTGTLFKPLVPGLPLDHDDDQRLCEGCERRADDCTCDDDAPGTRDGEGG